MKFIRAVWKMLSMEWWIFIVCLAGVLPPPSFGVHVFVRDEKRYAVLFQSVVLPCQYNSVSTQTPVVQWVYKSYCRDRTRDSFSHADVLSGGLGGGGLNGGSGGAGGGYETGMRASYLDCADSSRTVRMVASISGSSVTLSEYYKNRDISINNKADLRIGEVQWGDSGVYMCKVVISDDLEGQNEASVELLVLVYEAGKGIKTGTSTPQTPAYPPYFVTGVPAMVPIAPPSLVDKVSTVPPSEGSLLTAVPVHPVGLPYRVPSPQEQDSLRVLQYVEKQLAHFNPARSLSHQSCNLSELSSLHEGETGFHQIYRTVQKKALPPILDHEAQPEPQRSSDNRSPESRHHRDNLPSPQRHRGDREPEPGRSQDESLPQRRYSDDPPPSSQSSRPSRNYRQQNHSEEQNHSRWNPRSEHLHRKKYHSAGRSGSLDELEEFVASYKQRRGAGEGEEEQGVYEMEFQDFSRYPSYRVGASQHFQDNEPEYCNIAKDHLRQDKKSRKPISPLHSPKRRGAEEDEWTASPRPTASSPSSSHDKDYDSAFLSSLLERKAKLRGIVQGKSGGDSDTPSKSSSKKSSGESSRHCSRSPSSRPEVESLPLYYDSEQSRTERPSPRPPPTSARSSQTLAHSLTSRREEPRDKTRKANTLLSRDSLIV
eukprot:XP_011608329.1 PREDICTED: immunoglobulin-like domain-containing receptor 2 isoform X3 [Takifugu rubripes]